MKKLPGFIFVLTLILLAAISCKKQTATFQSALPTDYLQLQPGKYVTYRLDSLDFNLAFGTVITSSSYQAKDVVDTLITDNLGRPSWRVIRYLSDTTGTAPWVPNETYMITATKQDVEVVENNLRFIKLVSPIVNGYNWPGNSYIDVTSDTFNVLMYMQGWTYTYDSVGLPFTTLGGETVANAITVDQRNEVIGNPNDSSVYSEINYSVEVYGKGIGLIYKRFLHKEYQTPNGSTPVSYSVGYGITLNMIDHN